MMRLSLLAIVCAVCFVAACSDPRNTALPDDPTKLDALKPQVEKLTPDERELLATYLTRRAMKGTMFGTMAGATDAKTIGEAIENQRSFKAAAEKQAAEEAALKAKAKAELEAAQKAMRDVVTVALVSKKLDVERGYSGIEMDRKIQITLAYKNNGAKDIAGVKGRVVVNDLFGDQLSVFGISNDDTIRAGSTVMWTGGRSMRFSLGDNKDAKFLDLADDKFRVVWEPQMIVFSDGTKMTATAN